MKQSHYSEEYSTLYCAFMTKKNSKHVYDCTCNVSANVRLCPQLVSQSETLNITHQSLVPATPAAHRQEDNLSSSVSAPASDLCNEPGRSNIKSNRELAVNQCTVMLNRLDSSQPVKPQKTSCFERRLPFCGIQSKLRHCLEGATQHL